MNVAALLPRFREAQRSLGALEERESWSRAQIEDYQLDRLNAVWRHATTYVPYYRQMASERGLPESFRSLRDFVAGVPLLRRSQIQTNARAWLSEKPSRGRWIATSGTTGTPLRVYWAHAAQHRVLQSRYRFNAMWGVDIFDRSVLLWGDRLRARSAWAGLPARLRRAAEDRLRHRIRLPANRLDRSALRAYLGRISAFKPVSLYSYSTVAYLLAREALAVGFRCDSLKVAILTAEPASEGRIATVEEALHVPAVMEYGAIDCGLIAVEWPDRTLRTADDLVFLETLPRPDGHFDVAVTVLTNPSFPLLRYLVGDVTDVPIVRDDRGFGILQKRFGRSREMLVSRRGGRIHCSSVIFVVEAEPNVRRFQVRQEVDGAVSVLLEPVDVAAGVDTAAMCARLSDLVEGFPVTVQLADQIAPSPVEKNHWLVSNHSAIDPET